MSTDTLTEPAADTEAWNEPAVMPGFEMPAATEGPAGAGDRADTEGPAAGGVDDADDPLASLAAAVEAPKPDAACLHGKLFVLLTMPLRILIAILVLIDVPFGFLGAGIKRIIGMVAIATSIVAAATWIGGPFLISAIAHAR